MFLALNNDNIDINNIPKFQPQKGNLPQKFPPFLLLPLSPVDIVDTEIHVNAGVTGPSGPELKNKSGDQETNYFQTMRKPSILAPGLGQLPALP